jgi:hypothetical protein
MLTVKTSGAIGFGAGAIVAGLLTLWWHTSNPVIKIVKETPTVTTVTHQPSDYQTCKDCVNSKGEIKETINDKNVMHITYEDACKAAEKDVTLKSYSPNRHLLMFQFVNTSFKDSLITYGGDVSYYYMLWNRLGLGGGIMANAKSISPHFGIVYSW